MFANTNPDSPNYSITLLRHAESVGNLQKYHQGQVDYPLTETGKEQAHALLDRWLEEGKHFDLIISSPLVRARHTAEVLAEGLKIPLITDPVWMERDNGLLGGLKMEDAQVRHPQPAFIHPYQQIGERGESQWELYLRAGQAVQSLIRRPPAQYLVVSHGAILNMVLYAMLGIVPQANFQGPRFRFPNTAFASLIYKPESHTWFMTGLNDRRHWDRPKEVT